MISQIETILSSIIIVAFIVQIISMGTLLSIKMKSRNETILSFIIITSFIAQAIAIGALLII